ncbi:isthmin-2 isoform X2 [Denticeps clupeoides]|uniref:AMOP domain-containing protein n=1 Tax=Denticeps clupeoides TaxID=299321 RepID=A0AAY4A259_9TELE|nr:isthmin-2-like isoform X2 [Denticeps clupeoides]
MMWRPGGGVGSTSQPRGQGGTRDARQTLESIQQQNQLRSGPSVPRHPNRRWFRQRSEGTLPKPVPEEETFILDLKNFPDLANADLGSQNPNIQVTIEVVDDPQMELEMDLAKGSSEIRLDHNKLFWPLFWEIHDPIEEGPGQASLEENGEDDNSDGEDPILSSVGGDWGNRWKGWDSKDIYDYEEQEWSAWSPCSVTCGQGNQKRIRSCGYACTATESRTCDAERCPDEMNSVTELMPHELENGTLAFDTDVDSCEKWLNCKSEFLQKYLHQVLTELPGCPCAYPSEAVYSAVNVFDRTLGKTYRWRDASGPKERLDIYKPSARFCARSMLSFDSTTLAAQHCCYDDHMKLITRGKGAGAPNLISTEFSPELHYKVDVLPWILCKGDWSRFHSVRPPNNGLRCEENPREDVYISELEEAREY